MNKITIETSFYLLVANLSQNYGSFQTLYRTSQKKVSKKVILIWKSHFTTRNKIKKTHYYTCLENVHETRGVYILVSFVPRSDVFMLKSKWYIGSSSGPPCSRALSFSLVPGFIRVEQTQEQTNKGPKIQEKSNSNNMKTNHLCMRQHNSFKLPSVQKPLNGLEIF